MTIGEFAVNAVVGGALMGLAEDAGEALGSSLMGAPSGSILRGSPTVFINGLPAARVTDAESCDAGKIAQGSGTVFINGLPAARAGDKATCGAVIIEGSGNVFIGGGAVTVLPIQSEVPQSVRWAAVLVGILPALRGAARALGPALAKVEATGIVRAAQTGVKALGRQMEARAGKSASALSPHVAETAERIGIPSAKVQEILDMPKASRPPPDTYIPPERLAQHGEAFEDGASRITLQQNLEKYGLGQRDGTTFISTKGDTDRMLADAGGDPRKLEEALGLPSGQLDDSQLVRVDFTPEAMRDLSMRMPSGQEAGANEHWLPGGYLPNGQNEAVIDGVKALPEHYVTTVLNP
ncbi:PAAR domain-containing protein [Sphingomonas sp. Leaf242]|uniref:PAAR domain-containing protein n=1 Tax=Sphingomonas sp. Leaf242 TaxID=1736304 RepID=UPI000A71D19C|nr:PAAR domain-containing protein [Sphingomonas sp. Leaf242]